MMRISSCELKEANAFVERLHRHHKPVVGHRFSIKVVDDDGETLGVCIVGRPVSRHYDHTKVLEVTRLCTDGTPNAHSDGKPRRTDQPTCPKVRWGRDL